MPPPTQINITQNNQSSGGLTESFGASLAKRAEGSNERERIVTQINQAREEVFLGCMAEKGYTREWVEH